ncbi:imm11 family protein [Roseibium sediminis]|uniref:imm11 family protein n=1 Tax=Roseibium sediminis TaxID=1775174 RepID=UPI00123D99AE|nr:DUF1629 domain-containing protein [Roseibium sediminis]
MVYRIFPDYPGMHRYGVKHLNGDPDKVEALDITPDEAKILPGYSIFAGRPVDTTHLPTKVQAGGRKRTFKDISPDGLYSVSENFREVVERLEPGVHQFVPVEFVWKDGTHAANRYWYFPCNRLDSVDREKTTEELEAGIMWMPSKNPGFVFSRSQIGDCHLWRDKFMPSSYGPFISNALYKAFVEAGIEGMGVQELPETD